VVQRFAHLLREVTGALRIYIGSLNEGSPHFHYHLLPRLPATPNNAIGWIGLSDLARRGEVRTDPQEVARVLAGVRERQPS
jgi:diadenosine tetraphosphate (Ap4A) HIT family hydrolase